MLICHRSNQALCRPALQPPRHHGLPPHLRHYYPPPVSAYARHPFYMTTCAAATAACGPGAKMSLAYATGPFSVPRGPAGAPRTTGGQILYGALQPPPQNSPWSSLKSAPTRCEPIPAFPLLPETPTCLAWPSAASTSARCEPFSPNRLTPASRAQAPGPTLWQQAPGNRQLPAMLLC